MRLWEAGSEGIGISDLGDDAYWAGRVHQTGFVELVVRNGRMPHVRITEDGRLILQLIVV